MALVGVAIVVVGVMELYDQPLTPLPLPPPHYRKYYDYDDQEGHDHPATLLPAVILV